MYCIIVSKGCYLETPINIKFQALAYILPICLPFVKVK